MAGENENVVIEGDVNANGLTAEEQAQFDGMRNEAPAEVEGVEHQDTTRRDPEGGNELGKLTAVDGVKKDDVEDDDDEPGDAGGKEGASDAQGGQRRRGRVSMSKFEREVAARDKTISDLTERLQSQGVSQAKIEERLAIINEAFGATQKPDGKPQQDEDPEPDAEADIFAHNAWMKRELGRVRDAMGAMEERGQLQEAETMVRETYESDVHSFVQKQPDFPMAYQFLMANRMAELAEYFFGKDLTAEGATLTPQEIARINRTIVAEERDIVTGAIRDQKSPTERMYRLARARGYRPAEKKAAAGAENGKGKGNGGAPNSLSEQAAAAEGGNGNGAAKPNVRDEIERAKAGVADSVSLSNAGGAPKISLTPERMATMSDAEFESMMAQLTPEQLRLAMGGDALN